MLTDKPAGRETQVIKSTEKVGAVLCVEPWGSSVTGSSRPEFPFITFIIPEGKVVLTSLC